SWQVAPPAPGLEDRRVEVTGPTYKKMTINALNSGAKVWLADQEDANTPQWDSVIQGQINLLDSLTRESDYTRPECREYKRASRDQLPATVLRSRGRTRPGKHSFRGGEEASGSLVYFALFFATAVQGQIEKGRGPYFYLAKMET